MLQFDRFLYGIDIPYGWMVVVGTEYGGGSSSFLCQWHFVQLLHQLEGPLFQGLQCRPIIRGRHPIDSIDSGHPDRQRLPDLGLDLLIPYYIGIVTLFTFLFIFTGAGSMTITITTFSRI